MPDKYTICTNASQYDHGVIGACFEDGMASLKTSCKITDINYGPLHVTSGQNTTRCPIVQTDICRGLTMQWTVSIADDFFRSTLPEGTHDCEANATFNYDEVEFCLSLKRNLINSGDHQGLL